MAALRYAVYVAPPIPLTNPPLPGMLWQPISSTLIYTDTEAALVDTPITVDQTKDLISWIDRVAPGRKLKYVYITHGHGDHFFGIPQLLEHFPGATAVATPGVVAEMKLQLAPDVLNGFWTTWFPGQVYMPQQVARPLPPSEEFVLNGKYALQAIETGHTDAPRSTILWVPDLKLAVCGDVVYGQAHQFLMYANTSERRREWIRAVEQVEALGPARVVPGHKLDFEADGVWHLERTKKYIQDFDDVVAQGPKSQEGISQAMLSLYPERFNPGILAMSAQGAWAALTSNEPTNS